MITVRAHGHPAVTATHAKTFELTRDAAIGARATCVIGVAAEIEGDPAGLGLGPVDLVLEADGRRAVVHAEANPFFDPAASVIVRGSDVRGADTIAVHADTLAAQLDRTLVAALRDPATVLVMTVRPVGPRTAAVVVADRPVPWQGPRLTVITPADPLPDAADNAVFATGPLAQVAACAALARAPDSQGDALLLGPLPKGASARRARLAAAQAAAAAVVWRGPAAEAKAFQGADHVVVAVDRGEPATQVQRGWPERLPPGATVTVALPGRPQASDVEPLLRALLAEGVSARTLRQALAQTPQLGQWDYDDLKRL